MLVQIERQDATIKLSQERFEACVQGSSDGIWDWDLAQNTIVFSPR